MDASTPHASLTGLPNPHLHQNSASTSPSSPLLHDTNTGLQIPLGSLYTTVDFPHSRVTEKKFNGFAFLIPTIEPSRGRRGFWVRFRRTDLCVSLSSGLILLKKTRQNVVMCASAVGEEVWRTRDERSGGLLEYLGSYSYAHSVYLVTLFICVMLRSDIGVFCSSHLE